MATKDHSPCRRTTKAIGKATFAFQTNTCKEDSVTGIMYAYEVRHFREQQHANFLQYLIDNYKFQHDPDTESITEKTTGRRMNILDVDTFLEAPSSRPTSHSARSAARPESNHSYLAYGRPLSPDRIAAPRPAKPQQAYSQFTHASKARDLAMDTLSRRMATQTIDSSDESQFDSDSDIPSDQPSSNTSSSASSGDSDSDSDHHGDKEDSFRDVSPPTVHTRTTDHSHGSRPLVGECVCRKYGILRDGRKIKLDCYGKVCRYKESVCSFVARGGSSSDDSGREYKVKTMEPSRSSKHSDSRYESKTDSRYDSKTSSRRR